MKAALVNKGSSLLALHESVARRTQLVKTWVVFTLWNRITMRTPVRTGRARASWNIGIGEPDPTVPASGSAHHQPTIPEMEIPLGVPVYVTSNLSYIIPLENGHSQRQAPEGMVRVSLLEVTAELNAATTVEQLQGGS